MASLNDSESLKYSPNAFKMANVCILVLKHLYHMKNFTLETHYSKVHIIAKRVYTNNGNTTVTTGSTALTTGSNNRKSILIFMEMTTD